MTNLSLNRPLIKRFLLEGLLDLRYTAIMHADIRIASPCKADWNRMAGDDRVRHCAECNLNVYNFAAMTSAEAEELLSNREGRLCLRLYQRRDGTILTNDCPIGFQVKIRHISRIAGAALSGAMTVVSAVAHTLPNKPPAATQPKQGNLKVALSDASGAVIPNAQIRLSDSSGHERFSGKTRDNGVLQTNLPVGEYRLDITSPGFQNFHQTH